MWQREENRDFPAFPSTSNASTVEEERQTKWDIFEFELGPLQGLSEEMGKTTLEQLTSKKPLR